MRGGEGGVRGEEESDGNASSLCGQLKITKASGVTNNEYTLYMYMYIKEN